MHHIIPLGAGKCVVEEGVAGGGESGTITGATTDFSLLLCLGLSWMGDGGVSYTTTGNFVGDATDLDTGEGVLGTITGAA